MLENPIQKIETSTCGPLQIYFYDNFFPDENSKLHSYKNLTKKTAETLLKKLLISTGPKTKWGNYKQIHKGKKIKMR